MSLGNSRSAIKVIKSMPKEVMHQYMASGKVTVGHVDQVVKNSEGKNVMKRWYVAKIRGVIVGNNGEWQHETPEKARDYGREVLKEWKRELNAP